MASEEEGVLEVRVDTYDVFAGAAFEGNQLAVFSGSAVPRLAASVMQALAKEMNYAESTFVFPVETTSDDDAAAAKGVIRARFRIFTSDKELPFAGHPTLGTAFHLFSAEDQDHEHTTTSATTCELRCAAGVVTVTRVDEALLWMRQLPPTIDEACVPAAEIAATLACPVDALAADDSPFAARVVSTGTPFLIAALTSLDALRDLKHPGKALSALCAAHEVVGVYCVVRGGRDETHTVSARSLVDESAVPEDPATGSACGCFAGWAVQCGWLDGSSTLDVVVGQGHEIKRPSLLHARAEKDAASGAIRIDVGGRVVPMLRGAQVRLPPSVVGAATGGAP